jgi:hypothetical protein
MKNNLTCNLCGGKIETAWGIFRPNRKNPSLIHCSYQCAKDNSWGPIFERSVIKKIKIPIDKIKVIGY